MGKPGKRPPSCSFASTITTWHCKAHVTISALASVLITKGRALHWYCMLLRHEGFRRLCVARDLLREQCEPSLSIEELARGVQISPFHFIRQFEAVFGVTPHQFRIQTRLDAAKHLLAMGQHSVTDVCMAVGFSSLGSFSALFARRVGEPPTAYRRRVRSAGAGSLASFPPS